jgi:putative ABC transport system permease protein
MPDSAITPTGLGLGSLMLLIPFAILLWERTGLWKESVLAVVRMIVQLLFVGVYLDWIFRINHPLLNLLWLAVMIAVADGVIFHRSGFRMGRLLADLFWALLIGTAVPLLIFVLVILSTDDPLGARYLIPIGGMILGNCLRSNVVGLRSFYQLIRKQEKAYLYLLAQGATRGEATAPFLRDSLREAFSPMLATLAAAGLVSLPGMMTGVILAGQNPMEAIGYQIAIMSAIFTGTAITVLAGIKLTARKAFTSYGLLKREIFAKA